jgi:hypothetical protein
MDDDLRHPRECGTGHCDACRFAGVMWRVGPLMLCRSCFDNERGKMDSRG